MPHPRLDGALTSHCPTAITIRSPLPCYLFNQICLAFRLLFSYISNKNTAEIPFNVGNTRLSDDLTDTFGWNFVIYSGLLKNLKHFG